MFSLGLWKVLVHVFSGGFWRKNVFEYKKIGNITAFKSIIITISVYKNFRKLECIIIIIITNKED